MSKNTQEFVFFNCFVPLYLRSRPDGIMSPESSEHQKNLLQCFYSIKLFYFTSLHSFFPSLLPLFSDFFSFILSSLLLYNPHPPMMSTSHNAVHSGEARHLRCSTFAAPHVILVSHLSIFVSLCVCVCQVVPSQTRPQCLHVPWCTHRDTHTLQQSSASCSPLLQGIECTNTTSWAQRESACVPEWTNSVRCLRVCGHFYV